MAIDGYYINNKSFHGLQTSKSQGIINAFHNSIFTIIKSSCKSNIRFLIETSKLSKLLTTYMVHIALIRGGNFSIRRYT